MAKVAGDESIETKYKIDIVKPGILTYFLTLVRITLDNATEKVCFNTSMIHLISSMMFIDRQRENAGRILVCTIVVFVFI